MGEKPANNIILFEDQFIEDMQPIAYTRPAFAVTCACYNLYDVAKMVSPNVRYVVRDYLRRITPRSFEAAPRVEGPTLFLNAAVAPDVRWVDRMKALLADGKSFLCPSGQRVAAALLAADEAIPTNLTPTIVTPYLLDLNLPLYEEPLLKTVDFPFFTVKYLAELFPENLKHKIASKRFRQIWPNVFVGENVDTADTAVFSADAGPIVLDDGVTVMDFDYFQGPLYVGPNSRITERSSVKGFTSIGPHCKIGGEVEACIVEAYSNKQHHGFLGHTYVGSWVNLGAGTSNSNLKNTYGGIRIMHRGRRVETGMQFFGCVIGDFAKSAINTSIFTGKSIGVASMLYGYIGGNVPSFCNYAKSFGQVSECPLDQIARTQKRMFARRNVEQTEEDIALLKAVFENTRRERQLTSELPIL